MGERNKIPVTTQLFLCKDNKVLLMKRKNTGYEDGKYCLPGGHVESGEEIRQAMKREAKEEIGIDLNIDDLKIYKVLNRKINGGGEYIDFIFMAQKWTGDVTNIEEDKCEELLWTAIEDIPDNTLDFIKKVVEDKSSIYLSFNW